MRFSQETSRRLAAARDIGAVALFCLLVFFGGRGLLESPHLQKERLQKWEVQEDFAAFFSSLEARRPEEAARYVKLKTRALEQADARLDEFARVPVRDFAYILYQAAAAAGPDEVKVLWQPPRRWKDPELKFPPFGVALADGRFVLESALDPSLNGAQPLAVNGAPFGEFIAPALERLPGEDRRYREHLFCRDQAFWWDFSALFAGTAKIRLQLKNRDGRKPVRELEPIKGWEFRRLDWRAPPAAALHYSQKKISWLNVSGAGYGRAERKAYEGFFRELGRQGTLDLVVDLRDYSAADPRAADLILARLQSAFSTGLRPGRVKVLVGPGSGPAAAWLAARLRALEAGEILGSEPGALPARFAPAEEFKLPHSGIRVSVSRRLPPRATPVKPDLALTPQLLRPFKGDAAAFLLDRIDKERARAAGK